MVKWFAQAHPDKQGAKEGLQLQGSKKQLLPPRSL